MHLTGLDTLNDNSTRFVTEKLIAYLLLGSVNQASDQSLLAVIVEVQHRLIALWSYYLRSDTRALLVFEGNSDLC